MELIDFAIYVHTHGKIEEKMDFRYFKLTCPSCGSNRFISANVVNNQLYFVCANCDRSNPVANIFGFCTGIPIDHV